jgi:putative transposase
MPQTATIKSLPVAFAMMKAMQAEGVEWGEEYRAPASQALAELLEGRMGQLIDEHLERMAELGQADRRNGCYTRWLLTELGMIELHVPRTRTFSALKVVRAYARRAKDVDRMILACFLLGLSTRKVAIALLPILGRPVSPATVSAVARQLDAAVAAFHRRPLKDSYRVLVLDGVVLKRKTGAGALARPVLVALGLRPDGKKEVIDFRLATAESAAQWEQFLGDLVRRGLTGEHLEMLCVDGGSGLLAALPTAFPDIPVQRCWAHKIRNVLAKVRKTRPGRRQGRPAPDHERHDPAGRLVRRAWLRRSLGEPLSQGGRMPPHRPRRPAHLLLLPDSRRAQGGAHHQRD